MLVSLAAGAALASAIMFGLWIWARRIRNAGVVDVGWAFGIGIVAALYAACGEGFAPRRAAVGALALVWSLRLTAHLWRRVVGHPEEGRYAELRARRGDRADAWFFWFFQAQAATVVLLSAPFLLASARTAPSFAPVEVAGVLLFVVATSGEALADAQLRAWRGDPAHRGRTCRRGLWAYSRHPNYFCEWLIWVAFAMVAWPAPNGPAALACPALILFLILKVTGIPPTEAQALRSRGDDYRAYQREVSAFVPWFPRRAGGAH